MCIRYKSPYHDDILLRREREKKNKNKYPNSYKISIVSQVC